MRLRVVPCVALAVLVALPAAAGAGQKASGAVPAKQVTLQKDLTSINARIGSGRPSSQQVIADARLLTAGYRSLEPMAAQFGPSDYAVNRQLAQGAFAWLTRARLLYAADPLVNAELLNAYASMGGFYRDYGSFYPAGAFIAYGGASRMARLRFLNGNLNSQIEGDVARYSLAYATAAYAYGAAFNWSVPPGAGQEPAQLSTAVPPTKLTTLVLPMVDASTLSAGDKAAWEDIRTRFRTTAAKVHDARVLMEDMSRRLANQGLTMNLQDAATAARMQGFLEDAVELIEAKQFEMARTALVRAEYERGKLKGVTGQ